MTNVSHGPYHYREQRIRASETGLIVYHVRILPEDKEIVEKLVLPYKEKGDAHFKRVRAEQKRLERESRNASKTDKVATQKPVTEEQKPPQSAVPAPAVQAPKAPQAATAQAPKPTPPTPVPPPRVTPPAAPVTSPPVTPPRASSSPRERLSQPGKRETLRLNFRRAS